MGLGGWEDESKSKTSAKDVIEVEAELGNIESHKSVLSENNLSSLTLNNGSESLIL